MVVTSVIDKAGERYEMANAALAAGKTESADSYLTEAYTLALSVDNDTMICKILLSRVSLELASGNAASRTVLSDLLNRARAAARISPDREKLEAVCTLYDAACMVAASSSEKKDLAQSVDTLVLPLEKILSKDLYYLAFLYRVRGAAASLSGLEYEAAQCYEKAAGFHTRGRYIQEIGLDWYSAARSYSRMGNRDAALSLLERALIYDRDAENTAALGADYYAQALILSKTGSSAEDRDRAVIAARRSQAIYQAGNFAAPAAVSGALADKISAQNNKK
jgi:tetratricopeptide (TPR) repeat protein